jgi:hypothetical protein
MKLVKLISELEFHTYQGMVRISYNEKVSLNKIADAVRALPGVTVTTQAGSNKENRTAVFKIKLISLKPPLEAFDNLKNTALTKVPAIKRFEIGSKTIEKK